MKRENPKDTDAFAKVGMIIHAFRDVDPDTVIAAIARSDGTTDRLTHGHLRDLQVATYDAGDRLQRIAAWHSRETADGGLTSDYCVECGCTWPCETRRMADGTHEDLKTEGG